MLKLDTFPNMYTMMYLDLMGQKLSTKCFFNRDQSELGGGQHNWKGGHKYSDPHIKGGQKLHYVTLLLLFQNIGRSSNKYRLEKGVNIFRFWRYQKRVDARLTNPSPTTLFMNGPITMLKFNANYEFRVKLTKIARHSFIFMLKIVEIIIQGE